MLLTQSNYLHRARKNRNCESSKKAGKQRAEAQMFTMGNVVKEEKEKLKLHILKAQLFSLIKNVCYLTQQLEMYPELKSFQLQGQRHIFSNHFIIKTVPF